MRLLLDTHALLWWLLDDPQLSETARAAIADPDDIVFVSAASAWEVTTKFRLGKLPQAALLAQDFAAIVMRQGFEPLPISLQHGTRAGGLQGAHKDPFDRMLMAQALSESLMLVSNENAFDSFGVLRLW